MRQGGGNLRRRLNDGRSADVWGAMNSLPEPIHDHAALLTRWSASIRRWAFVAMGDCVAADDAAQDAAIRLLARLGDYDRSRPFAPWLKQLVRNVCADHHRHRGRRPTLTSVDAPMNTAADRTIDLARAHEQALDALSILTERQREILIAVDHEGEAPWAVAASLGIAPSTVRATLFQARRLVRARMIAENPDLADLVEGL